MQTLRQQALAYEQPQILNIADLDKVSVDIQLLEKESKDSEGKPFMYKYAEIGTKQYRVPNSVLEELQTILKLKPSVLFVKVKKTGTGLATRYKVEALD